MEAHIFQRTKDRAPPLRTSLNFSIVFPKHLDCSNHAPPNGPLERGLPGNELPNPIQKTH